LVRGPASDPAQAALRVGRVELGRRPARAADASANTVPAPAETPHDASLVLDAGSAAAITPKKRTASRAARPSAVGTVASASEAAASTPTVVVSDWGRVGQALARGDGSGALAALDGLAESDDQRTRDKADLGRAQLLMAHGNPERACALARSLSHRRAGGRIERQAQLLLKSCGR
jgi:hypothetical protein